MGIDLLPDSPTGEYICGQDLNLYVLSNCQELATQAQKNRHFQIVSPIDDIDKGAVQIYLCEDGYSAWLKVEDLKYLQSAMKPYQGKLIERPHIESLIPQIIEFTHQRMKVPNFYLWGGTTAPNYDCSGLMQSAFAHFGIWLPRDSYQQEAFTQRIEQKELMAGDLIFFGDQRVNHVALYLGDNNYIHSSGKETGNNGISINQLADNIDRVSSHYYSQLWSFGRIVNSFIPHDRISAEKIF